MDISLQIYFGGTFIYTPVLAYTNGTMVDVVDTDFLIILEVEDIIRAHGYANIIGWFYKFLRERMEDMIQVLNNEKQLMKVVGTMSILEVNTLELLL